jgi:hypothetical protein
VADKVFLAAGRFSADIPHEREHREVPAVQPAGKGRFALLIHVGLDGEELAEVEYRPTLP